MKNSQKGAAIIEMAFLLPLAMLICFVGAFLAYQVRTKVHAVQIAGLTSQYLYRDCRYENPLVRGTCMDNLKALIESTNQVSGFQTRVILSYYEDPSLQLSPGPFSTPTLFHRTAIPVNLGGDSLTTEVDIVPARPHLSEHFRLTGSVWVTEVYVKNPMTFVGWNDIVYEVAVG